MLVWLVQTTERNSSQFSRCDGDDDALTMIESVNHSTLGVDDAQTT